MKKIKLALLGVLLLAMNSCKKAGKIEVDIPKKWMVSTLAGAGTVFYADGPGKLASFASLWGMVTDPAGNIFAVDRGAHCIRKVTPDGTVTTFAGVGNERGFVNGTGNAARFNAPYFITIDPTGNLYVADAGNNAIRKITPSAVVSTFAGGLGYGYADGPATVAKFAFPTGISIDASNNIYVADHDNNRIRKITPTGTVTTVAGTGSNGSSNGPANIATMSAPISVNIDPVGNLYFIEEFQNRIRKIGTDGIVSPYLPDNGGGGYLDGQLALSKVTEPYDLKFDAEGNAYITDTNNHVIRKVTLKDGLYVTSTFAGIQARSTTGDYFADGPPIEAKFTAPYTIAIDKTGNIYIGDGEGSQRIRKISLVDDLSSIKAETPEDLARRTWNKPTDWK